MGTDNSVSVVVPTRNRPRLLRQTLRTVLWQRGVDVDVVVVDDGSTSDTGAVVRGLGDDRIRLVRHEHSMGVSHARNAGVSVSAGTWVAFCDDDDLWAPDKLARQLQVTQSSGRSWAYTGAVNITVDLRIIGGAPPCLPDAVAEGLARSNLVPAGGSSVMVWRDFLPESRPFDPMLHVSQDWDLWIRLARAGRPAAALEPLVGYRVHGASVSRNLDRALQELDVIEQRYGGPVDRSTFHRYAARVSQRAGRSLTAAAFYLRAARHDVAYLRSGVGHDLLEVTMGAGRRLQRRMTGYDGPPPPPSQRYAGSAPWRAEAATWLRDVPPLEG